MKIPDDLSEAEHQAWEGFPAGTNVDFSTGDATEDDPANGGGWGPERQVRAEVLARLLCGEIPVRPGEIGSVRLVGARILGDLLLQDVNVQHSLWLEGCHMTGWIDLTMATTRSLQLDNCYLGSIRMIGTKIAGELSLRGSHVRGEKEPALQADMATVSGSVLCDQGFASDGSVLMPGLRAGAQVSFSRAHLNGQGSAALLADRLTCIDIFLDDRFRAIGLVSLAYASVNVLQDEKQCWPENLRLDGFTYDDLQPQLPARERLQWISRAGYRDQPYEQLAGYFRKLGSDDQARKVLLARRRARRHQQPQWLQAWGWLQDALAGYGYAPGRALAWLAAAFFVGFLYFDVNPPAPVNPAVHPTFNSALYSANVLLPLPGIGQLSDWNPQGLTLLLTVALRLVGWLLAITIGTAITRSLARR
jgi:hypothetical protein